MPSLDDVRPTTLSFHPELKQLESGIRARRIQMDLAEAKLAPEFFVMGEVAYVTSWAGNRRLMQKLDGVIGLGLRDNLNFWKNWEHFRAAKTDYRGLQLKENYASDGLIAKATEQYYQVLAAKEKMDALK